MKAVEVPLKHIVAVGLCTPIERAHGRRTPVAGHGDITPMRPGMLLGLEGRATYLAIHAKHLFPSALSRTMLDNGSDAAMEVTVAKCA